MHVVNGTKLCCNKYIAAVEWSLAEYMFQSDLRVLSLSAYDIILGMDWLEIHSPMNVHWKQKWMAIPYGNGTALLQDLVAAEDISNEVNVVYIMDVESPNTTSTVMLPEIQAILEEYEDVFAPPSGLPPPRFCDHAISLVPGARPVFIRPYHYAPVVKDEIES